ncbi:vacuolar protein-sorting-associated protein 37 homolog 1 isoform X1 [Vigna angularis]|uniref:vacuolar protein-sorting-associated protein 37 homolog 1 isoform X1 n=1 Tax=Phaseolus angularis TaxID=3914 RepID=UPI0022B31053|nr:vacuolar protein-sorting-associated protein 37 homolog 1 isoform X1 [Vigna angularis]
MFRFWGSQEQQSQDGSSQSQSWYPPSVVSSPSSSRPATPSGSSSSLPHRPSSHVPPSEAAGVIAVLKDKSVDELRKLLSDKDAYQQFLHSLDQVKIQTNLKDELCKENLQLAEENLQKEPRIMELRNQCRIIRTTELAAAKEKLNELEKQKEEMLKLNSPASLVQRIQESANKTEEESDNLHQHFLDGEIDLGAFLQKYKKLRTTYHKKTLIHLAAKTSTLILVKDTCLLLYKVAVAGIQQSTINEIVRICTACDCSFQSHSRVVSTPEMRYVLVCRPSTLFV